MRKYHGKHDPKSDYKYVFGLNEKMRMVRLSTFPIQRHIMVKRFASWDDPELEDYWNERSKKNANRELTRFQKVIAAGTRMEVPCLQRTTHKRGRTA
jgi:hypothetical protein